MWTNYRGEPRPGIRCPRCKCAPCRSTAMLELREVANLVVAERGESLMYMALCDDEGREIVGFDRRSLLDVRWVISPPAVDGDKYSIVNDGMIKFYGFRGERCWTSCVGIAIDVDLPPIAVLPMQRGYEVRYGDNIFLERGALVIRITSIEPGGRRTPDPDPLRSPRRAKIIQLLSRLPQEK